MDSQTARTLVLYHYPCFDGIWAAWAARSSFMQKGLTNAHFVPNRVFRPCTIEELGLQVAHCADLPAASCPVLQ